MLALAVAFAFPALAARFIAWVLGNQQAPGAAVRYGRIARRTFFTTVVLGFVLPAATMMYGLYVAIQNGDVDAARFVMGVGTIVSFVVLFFVGSLLVLPFDILGRILDRLTREESAWFLRAYQGFLIFFLFTQFVFWALGVYSPWGAIYVGLICGALLGMASFAWRWSVALGRHIVAATATLGIIWAVVVSVPSGMWLGTVGYDVPNSILFKGTVVDHHRLREAERLKAVRHRTAATNELDEIVRVLRNPRSTAAEVAEAEANLASWKRLRAIE